MATIQDSLDNGVLKLFELPDFESRLPINPLYYPLAFEKWIAATKELHDTAYAVGGRTLLEHLVLTLCDFRCSERPGAGDLRRMMPTKYGVWKVHPPDLRIYGWSPSPRSFVVVTGALETDTKTNTKLNDQKRDEVRKFIKDHDLSNHIVYGDILAIFPPKTE
jgi:hypothetical protein